VFKHNAAYGQSSAIPWPYPGAYGCGTLPKQQVPFSGPQQFAPPPPPWVGSPRSVLILVGCGGLIQAMLLYPSTSALGDEELGLVGGLRRYSVFQFLSPTGIVSGIRFSIPGTTSYDKWASNSFSTPAQGMAVGSFVLYTSLAKKFRDRFWSGWEVE
jgi:hypothetical protein